MQTNKALTLIHVKKCWREKKKKVTINELYQIKQLLTIKAEQIMKKKK